MPEFATASPGQDKELYNIVLPDVPNIVSSIEVKEEEITGANMVISSEDTPLSHCAPSQQILCGSEDDQGPILTTDIPTARVKVERVGDNVLLLPKEEQVGFDPMPSPDNGIDPLDEKTEQVDDAAQNEDAEILSC